MAVLTPPLYPRERFATMLPRGARHVRPIILALDGRVTDRSVVSAGRILKGRAGDSLVAVTVGRSGREPGVVGPEEHADLPIWHTSITGDGAATAIVAESMSVNARLLVIGRTRHDIWEQLVQAELPLEVVRRSDRPVLVVNNTFTALPRCAVVAISADDTTRRAAKGALELIAPGGTLVLAHVVEPHASHSAAKDLLAARAAALQLPPGVHLQSALLHGPTVPALLSLARRTHADLIAAGVSGARDRARMYAGGVATQLLRKSTCSLLLTPACC